MLLSSHQTQSICPENKELKKTISSLFSSFASYFNVELHTKTNRYQRKREETKELYSCSKQP